MSYTLKDRSFEFSETEVTHEVFLIGALDGSRYEIEFKLTFSYGFLTHTEQFVWLNDDVEILLEQVEKMHETESGTLGGFSPGISFSYEKYVDEEEEDLYAFTVHMDTGYINAFMGTESNLGITLTASKDEIKEWIFAFIKNQ